MLVALIAVLWIAAPGFGTSSNLTDVGRIAAALALAACGQAVVIITGGLDLSAGSVVAVMSVIAVLEIHLGVAAAFGLAVLAALGVGAINGLLVARFSVPPFLATLGMLTAIHGVSGQLVGGIPVETPPGGAFSWPSNGNVGPISAPLLLALCGIAVLALLLRRTSLGRTWFLIGSNPAAARAAGYGPAGPCSSPTSPRRRSSRSPGSSSPRGCTGNLIWNDAGLRGHRGVRDRGPVDERRRGAG